LAKIASETSLHCLVWGQPDVVRPSISSIFHSFYSFHYLSLFLQCWSVLSEALSNAPASLSLAVLSAFASGLPPKKKILDYNARDVTDPSRIAETIRIVEKDRNVKNRSNACRLLATFEVWNEETKKCLLTALTDSYPIVRGSAISVSFISFLSFLSFFLRCSFLSLFF
jgi:hypothetical protein